MRIPPDASAALSSMPPTQLESAFQHLTAARLESLTSNMGVADADAFATLAVIMLRWRVYKVLDKRGAFGDVGAALQQHGWQAAVDSMRAQAGESKETIWNLVMEHEMTSYVPVQCQQCGQQVPDETQPGCTDEEVGISEDAPTDEERSLIRSGWYRGPRGPVVFVLKCPACGSSSRWFRSSAASVTLNPRRWGRLCGEQEDARSALAMHLGVPLRVALPLDWDHVWSEYLRDDGVSWAIREGSGDAPAANFAGRLDEGIGAWSSVLVIGSAAEPLHTCDATADYLACVPQGGRADASIASKMPRYRETVKAARADATGSATQAKSVNGHLVYVKAGMTPPQVTAVLRRAVEDHAGNKAWWTVPVDEQA